MDKKEKNNSVSYANEKGIDNCANNLMDNSRIDSITKYGEFVPSFDWWLSPEVQRERAKYLEKPIKK